MRALAGAALLIAALFYFTSPPSSSQTGAQMLGGLMIGLGIALLLRDLFSD
jgi:hypothetical protein